MRTSAMRIRPFRDADVEVLFRRGTHRRSTNVASVVKRKLDMFDAAEALDDLRSPPGNRLELLRGQRAGQHGIRVNDQWRICFRWSASGPEDVEIVDYH